MARVPKLMSEANRRATANWAVVFDTYSRVDAGYWGRRCGYGDGVGGAGIEGYE